MAADNAAGHGENSHSWLAVGPRDELPALEPARVLAKAMRVYHHASGLALFRAGEQIE